MKKISNRKMMEATAKVTKVWENAENGFLFIVGVGLKNEVTSPEDRVEFFRLVNLSEAKFNRKREQLDYIDITPDDLMALLLQQYQIEGISFVVKGGKDRLWSRYGAFSEDYPVVESSKDFLEYKRAECYQNSPKGFWIISDDNDSNVVIQPDGALVRITDTRFDNMSDNGDLVNICSCSYAICKLPTVYTPEEKMILGMNLEEIFKEEEIKQ